MDARNIAFTSTGETECSLNVKKNLVHQKKKHVPPTRSQKNSRWASFILNDPSEDTNENIHDTLITNGLDLP